MQVDPERQKVVDRGIRMMDAIKARYGEGEKFFAAMAVATEQLERYDENARKRRNTI